jgi:sodium transport system permease protein
MFGFLHVLLSLFQQLFNATLLGIVLGLLAVRSKSIVPGLIFHFLNNAIAVSQGFLAKAGWAKPIIPWIYRNPDDGLYHVVWTVVSALLLAFLLFYLWRLKFETRHAHAPGPFCPPGGRSAD